MAAACNPHSRFRKRVKDGAACHLDRFLAIVTRFVICGVLKCLDNSRMC
jgi:hypothetical protein